jgi:hypothetical protein
VGRLKGRMRDSGLRVRSGPSGGGECPSCGVVQAAVDEVAQVENGGAAFQPGIVAVCAAVAEFEAASASAGDPETTRSSVPFATKGDLAKAVIVRALASPLPIAWVSGAVATPGSRPSPPKPQQVHAICRIDFAITQASGDAVPRTRSARTRRSASATSGRRQRVLSRRPRLVRLACNGCFRTGHEAHAPVDKVGLMREGDVGCLGGNVRWTWGRARY